MEEAIAIYRDLGDRRGLDDALRRRGELLDSSPPAGTAAGAWPESPKARRPPRRGARLP